MRTSRYSDSQIMNILKQAEAGDHSIEEPLHKLRLREPYAASPFLCSGNPPHVNR